MKSVKIFSTVENYELMKILDAVKPAEYKAGAEIIKEVSILFVWKNSKKIKGR